MNFQIEGLEGFSAALSHYLFTIELKQWIYRACNKGARQKMDMIKPDNYFAVIFRSIEIIKQLVFQLGPYRVHSQDRDSPQQGFHSLQHDLEWRLLRQRGPPGRFCEKLFRNSSRVFPPRHRNQRSLGLHDHQPPGHNIALATIQRGMVSTISFELFHLTTI